MPVVPGLTGYQDWQRTSQVDTPALVTFNGAVAGVQSFPVGGGTFDVSRFACTALYLEPSATNGALVTLIWFLDPAGSVEIGARQVVVPGTDTVVFDPTSLIIPNRGPYLQIGMQDVKHIATWGMKMTAWATNRTSLAISQPIRPTLVGIPTPLAVPALSSVDRPVPSLYQGEATISINNGGGGATAYILFSLDTLGFQVPVASATFTNSITETIAVPLAPNTLRLTNQTGAAQGITYALTQGVGGGV